ncbi:hypothetical protein [Vibrio phage LP.1]|nr:hypothetical protein [Vibrio phage LP.1]
MNKSDLFLHIIPRKEAKRLGLTRYFTGKPCKHGHVDERKVVNHACCECVRMAKLKRRDISQINPYILSVTDMCLHIMSRENAVSVGASSYLNLTPCKRGHIGPKSVTKQGCVQCSRYTSSKYREENREELRRKGREYAQENSNNWKEYIKLYEKKYPGRIERIKKQYALRQKSDPSLLKARKAACKKYYEHNKAYHHSMIAKRRANKLNATPSFFVKRKCCDIYRESKINGMHVDHIVPLQSDFVCGLHWHGNMQLLSPSENQSKGNRYWPDMPDTSDPDLLEMVREFKARESI